MLFNWLPSPLQTGSQDSWMMPFLSEKRRIAASPIVSACCRSSEWPVIRESSARPPKTNALVITRLPTVIVAAVRIQTVTEGGGPFRYRGMLEPVSLAFCRCNALLRSASFGAIWRKAHSRLRPWGAGEIEPILRNQTVSSRRSLRRFAGRLRMTLHSLPSVFPCED